MPLSGKQLGAARRRLNRPREFFAIAAPRRVDLGAQTLSKHDVRSDAVEVARCRLSLSR